MCTVALNTARDLGSRLMAITIWGLPGKLRLSEFVHTWLIETACSRWWHLRSHRKLNKHSCDFVSRLHLRVLLNWLRQRCVTIGKILSSIRWTDLSSQRSVDGTWTSLTTTWATVEHKDTVATSRQLRTREISVTKQSSEFDKAIIGEPWRP